MKTSNSVSPFIDFDIDNAMYEPYKKLAAHVKEIMKEMDYPDVYYIGNHGNWGDAVLNIAHIEFLEFFEIPA